MTNWQIAGGLLLTAFGGGSPVVAVDRTPSEPGQVFRECADCPTMIVVPPGTFVLGSPESERGRGKDEGPQQQISISRPFAVSRYEITRKQYERFVRNTHRPVGGGCITDRRHIGDWQPDDRTNFRDPGFAQRADHPVTCVSWRDAKDYVAWLNTRTRGGYRLLSEAEWEYAARAGTSTAYPWGDDPAQACLFINGTDRTARRRYANLSYIADFGTCDDRALNTAAVGSFRPNAFGIYDMIGNVGEWVEDCSSKTYSDRDGSAAPVTGSCDRRVVRGGSWGTVFRQLRSAERVNQIATDRDDSIGIRVALDHRA